MKYYLYSKMMTPETVLKQVKRGSRKRHPSITAIATYKKNVGIYFSLAKFADKYLDGGSRAMRWVSATKTERKQMFRDFMSINQEREGYNNFGIIAGDGTMYEPLEFLQS